MAGVVYTPSALARFVADRTLGVLDSSVAGRWLDPACGDGVFLREMVARLAGKLPAEDLPSAVQEMVFGVDIDAAACKSARDTVVDQVERRAGRQPPDYFTSNVVCADFLAMGPEELGSIAAVVGNPPYVSAEDLDADSKQRYLGRFESAWGRLDLYGLFFEQSLRMLASRGVVGFITPDKFMSSVSGRPLRRLIAREARVCMVDRFDRHDLFPGVATVPCVTVLTNDKMSEQAPATWWDAVPGAEPVHRAGADSSLHISRDGRPWEPVRTKRSGPSVPLSRLVTRISAGWATGLNPCFLLNDEARGSVEPELLRPTARGRDVTAAGIEPSGLSMLLPYFFDAAGEEPRLVDLQAFPRAATYLEDFRERLEARHCVRVWKKVWYDLHDPVTCDLATRTKILLPDLALEARFSLDEGTVLPLHSAYYLLPREDSPISPAGLTELLNAPAVAAELRERAPIAKSGYRRFRAQFLRDLPIPVLAPDDQMALFSGVEDAKGVATELMTWTLRRNAA